MDRRKCTRLRKLSLLLVVAIVGFLFGVIIMALAARKWRKTDEVDISTRISEEINADNIRNNLREATRLPHVAGTAADYNTAEQLYKLWVRQGLDSVKMVPYHVLLQYPPMERGNENRVQIVNTEGKDHIFESTLRPATFGEAELEQDGIMPPYNAFSGIGDIMGDLVYVNFGRMEDYEFLETNISPGINFTGKVIICRKGSPLLVQNAEKMNVAAVILFPDPKEFSVPPMKGATYPHGPYLPKSAPIWGTLSRDIGDALTPGYPATYGAFRVSEPDLPTIPVHPIGFEDAQKILSYMAGPASPAEWRGSLNVTYQVGPGFKDSLKNRKIRVIVNSTNSIQTIYNVIGFIRGSEEPDRYVIIGNHRDAWGMGAVDPTGGSAVLMELSRVFGMLKEEGWRPRRTMVFASWGAEEFGLIGSTEWTEQYHELLSKRTYAYLNLDIAVSGKYIVLPHSSPVLVKIVREALKKVPEPYPSETRKTLFDTLLERYQSDPDYIVQFVDGGTDFEAFVYGLGIPSINAFYYLNWEKSEDHPGFYSLYHTQYETFRLVDEFIDSGFLCHRAIGQLFAEMMLNIADSKIISGDVTTYRGTIYQLGEGLRDVYLERILMNPYRNITIEYLYNAIEEFAASSGNFQNTILPALDSDNPLAVRAINDQMMHLEQAFLSRERIPGKAVYRHALAAPSTISEINRRTFPGIMIAMDGIEDAPNPEERWAEVERQLAIVTHTLESAASVLRDFTSW